MNNIKTTRCNFCGQVICICGYSELNTFCLNSGTSKNVLVSEAEYNGWEDGQEGYETFIEKILISKYLKK